MQADESNESPGEGDQRGHGPHQATKGIQTRALLDPSGKVRLENAVVKPCKDDVKLIER